MPVPMIPNEDHEVLGTEFCSGYVDAFGKWNTGFYCPQVDVAEASYCCGTPTFKYCCSGKELGLERTTQEPDEELFLLIIGVGLGVTIGFSLLTLAVCFFLPGCMLSKKSKRKTGASLYRTENESSNILTQRGASFSESGSVYSIATTNNSSNGTSTTSGSAASDSVQVMVKNPYGLSSVMRTTLPRAVTRPTSFGKDTTIWESEDTADSRSLLSSLLLADSTPTSVVPMQHTVNSTFTGGVSPRLDVSAIERPKVLQLEEGFSSTKF